MTAVARHFTHRTSIRLVLTKPRHMVNAEAVWATELTQEKAEKLYADLGEVLQEMAQTQKACGTYASPHASTSQ